MSSASVRKPGVIKQLWYKWRALRLPWRKQWMVGADLAGNTFWEFQDALHAGRMRRIVRYGSTAHYGDVKISPQWHQWLRHTRYEAPTIHEQELDIQRQSQMKQLAARADERWKSQESFLEAPKNQQAGPAMALKDPGGYAPQTEPDAKQGVMNAVEAPQDVKAAAEGEDVDAGRFKGHTRERKAPREENPYTKAQRGAPSENWQPESWSPGPVQRR